MKLTYVPLLQLQRDLYRLPPGPDRFQEYLRTLIDAHSGDMSFPLSVMNPMAKEHVPNFLDQLIKLQGDEIAAKATDEAMTQLGEEPGDYRVTLVVCDDLKGGWTNRYTSDFDYRFRQKPYYQRGWIATLLWVSEVYSCEAIYAEVQMAILRAAYIQRHGYAQTLREMIAQESYAIAKAGVQVPSLDAEDLAYTRAVLAEYEDSTEMPTVIAALYGDEAAHQLGYTPLGLSQNAGLALAVNSMPLIGNSDR